MQIMKSTEIIIYTRNYLLYNDFISLSWYLFILLLVYALTYKVFAVADTKEIKTNSGIALVADDVIAHLKGHEDEFDALVFGCGDAVPKFGENAGKPYNQDMLAVIKTFGDMGKIMIGHCAAAMMFDSVGIATGKKVAIHPLAKPAIQHAKATDEKFEIDSNFYTAQTENTIWMMMPQVIAALKE